jgi:cell division septation protein DedD
MTRFRLALLAALLTALPALASVSSGVEKWRTGDWDGAVADWVAPAARGDADALFNMGQAYRLGRGVPLSIDSAIDYYRRAAAKGHVAATANLGITLWQDGRRTEALGHLRTAADQGDIRAAYVLGVATFTGDGAPRNPALGYAYIVRARDGGLAAATAQANRYGALLGAEERARGEAAAAALAAGRPIAVAFAELSRPSPAPSPPQAAERDGDEDEDSDTPAPRPRAKPAADKPATTKEIAGEKPARPGSAAAAERTGGAGRTEPSPKTEKPDPAAARAAEGGFRVQLGAYADERAARTAWATLVSQSAKLLKGQKPVYAPKGGLVRLQVGPFEDRAEARDLCAKLSAAGRPCFVTSKQ